MDLSTLEVVQRQGHWTICPAGACPCTVGELRSWAKLFSNLVPLGSRLWLNRFSIRSSIELSGLVVVQRQGHRPIRTLWACPSWWRHQLETFSALLATCAGNSPVPGDFPAQRPVTRSFDVFFDLRLNKRLSKQSWGWWFETLSCPLWRHCNDGRKI